MLNSSSDVRRFPRTLTDARAPPWTPKIRRPVFPGRLSKSTSSRSRRAPGPRPRGRSTNSTAATLVRARFRCRPGDGQCLRFSLRSGTRLAWSAPLRRWVRARWSRRLYRPSLLQTIAARASTLCLTREDAVVLIAGASLISRISLTRPVRPRFAVHLRRPCAGRCRRTRRRRGCSGTRPHRPGSRTGGRAQVMVL